jgi:dihydropteroate synthase
MLRKSTDFSENPVLNCRGKLLDLNRPRLMGILNLTPDSFFDGGRNLKNDFYLQKAEQMVIEGADILDIGAASSKPGSLLIDADEERKILEKPLRKLRDKFPNILYSVDTYHASTAQAAADWGVEIINDISGGQIDSTMFEVVGKNNLAYVMMHMQGRPENMQLYPIQQKVMEKVSDFFEKQLELIQAHGVESVLIDPGFGFGKTLDQNFVLLKKMNDLAIFNRPILVGLSRKSMIFKTLKTNPQEALNGTSVLNTLALSNGANILRVHDVREANETIQLYLKYKQF